MASNIRRVFFYGVFMDESLLNSNGVHLANSQVGYVDGFGLRTSERATLVPERDGRAYGVLMELTAREIAVLYSDAGVADYVAEPVLAKLPGGVEVSAECYKLPVDQRSGTNPVYAAALLALAVRLGLPDSYLEDIRRAAAGS